MPIIYDDDRNDPASPTGRIREPQSHHFDQMTWIFSVEIEYEIKLKLQGSVDDTGLEILDRGQGTSTGIVILTPISVAKKYRGTS